MCLLMTKPADAILSDLFLEGVYRKNSDGIGIMWADKGVLHMVKAVVPTAKEMVEFYRKHADGRACAVHFRMRTHGDINLENCHPYPVFGFGGEKVKHPMLFMHNGVLSTGNDKDSTKSDTWHYVRDFLRPVLKDNPGLINVPAFQDMLAEHVGSGNRLVLMDHTGIPVVINRKAGVEYEGCWLSNTYAWDYYNLHPNARVPAKTRAHGDWYGGSFGHNNFRSSTLPAPRRPMTPNAPVTKAIAQRNDTGASEKNPLPFEDEAIRFAERVLDISSKAFEDLTKHHIERLFKEFSVNEVETWIDMLECGVVSEEQFVQGMRDPRLVASHLKSPMGSIMTTTGAPS